MADERSLDDVLRELGEVQDELLTVSAGDFARRAELSDRQDALRLEAAELRVAVPDGLTADQLEKQIHHLEAEIRQHLDTRPSASAGSGSGRGGGIDPDQLHKMIGEMAKSFGLDAKQEQLRRLKVRLAELRGD